MQAEVADSEGSAQDASDRGVACVHVAGVERVLFGSILLM
jgi:hypothetical protein